MQTESLQPGEWPPLPGRPELGADELHLCRFGIADPGEAGRALLSAGERERLEHTRNPAAAREFLAGRVALRRILGRYARCPPEALEIHATASGKPELAGPETARVYQFNLSHCAGLGLVAVTHGGPVGVDLESLERELDWEPIAKRYLAPAEHAAIRAAPAADRRREFLQIWVRREALAKASGQGLARTLGPMRAAPATAPGPDEQGWDCLSVHPGPNYLACVAARNIKRLAFYDFRVILKKK